MVTKRKNYHHLLNLNETPQSLPQVFDIGRNERIPITGLEFMRVPGTNKYIVIAAAEDHVYLFTETVRPEERSPFQAIFRAYTLQTLDYLKSASQRICPSSVDTDPLRLCYAYSQHFARSFAILSDSDILYTELDAHAETHGNVVHTSHIPFPERQADDGKLSRNISPVAYALTDFHAVLVYPDHLVAISLLDYSIVYEEYFSDKFGRLLNVVRDSRTSSLYVYSTNTVFRLKVNSINDKS